MVNRKDHKEADCVNSIPITHFIFEEKKNKIVQHEDKHDLNEGINDIRKCSAN